MRPLLLLVVFAGGLLCSGIAFGGWWQLHTRVDYPVVSPRAAAEVWALENAPAKFRNSRTLTVYNNTTAICHPAVAWPARIDVAKLRWWCDLHHAGGINARLVVVG